MEENTLKILEFEKILDRMSGYCHSELSRRALMDLKPAQSIEDVNILQEETSEAYIVLNKYLKNPMSDFENCNEAIKKASIGITLSIAELLKIARLLRASRTAMTNVLETGDDVKRLKSIIEGLYTNPRLENKLFESILDEQTLSDNASPQLKEIRKKIVRQKHALAEKLNSYTKNNSSSKYLQDNIVTIRNGRYVLPVKSENRSMVQGLVHDQSASGSTLFIEPYAVVELNNDLKEFEAAEAFEIERILSDFTANIANVGQELQESLNILVRLDIIFAKILYSISIKATEPKINDDGLIRLIAARHPLIDKDLVVPVNISLGGENKILVISGANTGGKTVCMKTVGLLSAMAYCGIKIPCAEGSEIAYFDDIYCDIGDNQSIIDSLSTFSARVKNIVFITEHITNRSLVLLDEPGSGTDPEEGVALAIGIIKYIELMKAQAIISTHFGAVKEYAMEEKGIINACMQFDFKTLKPTYKLIMGLPGNSNALSIAKNLGLSDYIINQANLNLSKDKRNFDKILLKTAEIRDKAEQEKNDAIAKKNELDLKLLAVSAERQRLNKKLAELNENSKIEIRKLVRNVAEEADELLEVIKKEVEKGENASLLEAKKAKNKLWDLSYNAEINSVEPNIIRLDPKDIKEGKRVYVIKTGLYGIIKQQKKNDVFVQVGAMMIKAKPNELAYPLDEQANKENVTNNKNLAPSENFVTKEIKVLGMTVSEAIEIIEPEIMSLNINSGNKVLKIVHGKGTGQLARGIQEYLKKNKSVQDFRYGKYGEGDTGVTFVTVK